MAALPRHSKKVHGFQSSLRPFCSLQVLSGYSNFIPPSKDMDWVRIIGVSVCFSGYLCVSPAELYRECIEHLLTCDSWDRFQPTCDPDQQNTSNFHSLNIVSFLDYV